MVPYLQSSVKPKAATGKFALSQASIIIISAFFISSIMRCFVPGNWLKEKAYQWLKRYVDPASSVGGRLIDEMRETRFKEGFECPHCTSVQVVRFGKYNGRQRYKCKACYKTFNDLTNTILYRTRKGNKWIAFIECMIKGYSLRKSAEIIGGVTHVTLFYWRHKLLHALKQLDFSQFEGIVEVDETYFLYSEKGKRGITGRKSRKRGGSAKKRGISNEQVCVLVARDRAKSTVSKVVWVVWSNRKSIK